MIMALNNSRIESTHSKNSPSSKSHRNVSWCWLGHALVYTVCTVHPAILARVPRTNKRLTALNQWSYRVGGFLDAPSHFYIRLCPSVRPSVRPYVPCYFRRWKERILGASCAVYPALFPLCVGVVRLLSSQLRLISNRFLMVFNYKL